MRELNKSSSHFFDVMLGACKFGDAELKRFGSITKYTSRMATVLISEGAVKMSEGTVNRNLLNNRQRKRSIASIFLKLTSNGSDA